MIRSFLRTSAGKSAVRAVLAAAVVVPALAAGPSQSDVSVAADQPRPQVVAAPADLTWGG